ncbi:hypothetical protein HXX76_005748 [Chlamydomonas incerta]|uniref:Uncharacterized protein n=1 Tax=Chlamydomonas incerta TaxID=51695 RepID=A0A835TD32_CHLIN|nr:hypothetical protein HXX76_005748 [Chlamydomonas incerta]|eukprot:KAG2438139.1 hypothetical protein HXX76_005748 [Chlamydomonas incerta]
MGLNLRDGEALVAWARAQCPQYNTYAKAELAAWEAKAREYEAAMARRNAAAQEPDAELLGLDAEDEDALDDEQQEEHAAVGAAPAAAGAGRGRRRAAAIPFRRAFNGSSSGGSSANPVVAAMNVLMADFIDSGEATCRTLLVGARHTDTATLHFPMDAEALCRAREEAAAAAAASAGSSPDLVSISLVDVGGLFILQGAAVVLCLGALAAARLRRRCRQQPWRWGRRRRGSNSGGGGGGRKSQEQKQQQQGDDDGVEGSAPSSQLARVRSDMQLLGKHLKQLAMPNGGWRGGVTASSSSAEMSGLGGGEDGGGSPMAGGGGVPYTMMATDSPRYHPPQPVQQQGAVIVDMR